MLYCLYVLMGLVKRIGDGDVFVRANVNSLNRVSLIILTAAVILLFLGLTCITSMVAVSVMAQYTPAYKGLETPPFDRPVTKDEYESVVEAASDFGFENGWIQGYEASDPKLALLGENMPRGHGSVQ